jgi:hypothetical protein
MPKRDSRVEYGIGRIKCTVATVQFPNSGAWARRAGCNHFVGSYHPGTSYHRRNCETQIADPCLSHHQEDTVELACITR